MTPLLEGYLRRGSHAAASQRQTFISTMSEMAVKGMMGFRVWSGGKASWIVEEGVEGGVQTPCWPPTTTQAAYECGGGERCRCTHANSKHTHPQLFFFGITCQTNCSQNPLPHTHTRGPTLAEAAWCCPGFATVAWCKTDWNGTGAAAVTGSHLLDLLI